MSFLLIKQTVNMKTMKQTKLWLTMLLVGSTMAFLSCSSDDDNDGGTANMTITSIVANGTDLESGDDIEVDLNGATAAENVPLDASIDITFSKNVDNATATSSNVTLKKGSDAVDTDVSASGNTITLVPSEDLEQGTTYTLTVTGAVKASDGGAFTEVSRTFRTAGRGEVSPPQAENQIAYWNFNGSAVATEGDFETVFEQVTYTTDRFGFTNSAAEFGGASEAGQGDIIEIEASDDLITPSRTISVWFKVDKEDYNSSRFLMGMAAERGFFMELGSEGIAWLKLPTSHALDPDPMGHEFGINWSDPNGDGAVGGQILYEYEGSISDLVADGEWHQLVLAYDAGTSMKTIYVDGNKIMELDIDSDTDEWYLKNLAIDTRGVEETIDTKLAFGYAGSRDNQATDWANYANATNTFKGLMDDVRIFSVGLSATEVKTLYDAEKP